MPGVLDAMIACGLKCNRGVQWCVAFAFGGGLFGGLGLLAADSFTVE